MYLAIITAWGVKGSLNEWLLCEVGFYGTAALAALD